MTQCKATASHPLADGGLEPFEVDGKRAHRKIWNQALLPLTRERWEFLQIAKWEHHAARKGAQERPVAAGRDEFVQPWEHEDEYLQAHAKIAAVEKENFSLRWENEALAFRKTTDVVDEILNLRGYRGEEVHGAYAALVLEAAFKRLVPQHPEAIEGWRVETEKLHSTKTSNFNRLAAVFSVLRQEGRVDFDERRDRYRVRKPVPGSELSIEAHLRAAFESVRPQRSNSALKKAWDRFLHASFADGQQSIDSFIDGQRRLDGRAIEALALDEVARIEVAIEQAPQRFQEAGAGYVFALFGGPWPTGWERRPTETQ